MITAVLLIISAIAKALMDNLQFHYSQIRFFFIKNNPQFWNPAISCENKYKWGNGKPKLAQWLLQGPFVFITDGWHLSQFVFLNTLFIVLVIFKPFIILNNFYGNLVVNFIVYRLIFGIIFSIFYTYIWVKLLKK